MQLIIKIRNIFNSSYHNNTQRIFYTLNFCSEISLQKSGNISPLKTSENILLFEKERQFSLQRNKISLQKKWDFSLLNWKFILKGVKIVILLQEMKK